MDSPQESLHGLLVSGAIGSIVVAILFLVPLWRSLSRSGFSPIWSLLILIPYLWPLTIFGLVGVLAFGQWPAVVGPAERTSWSAFSSTSWVQVSPEEAAKNRHYGFDGWILAFYGLTVAGTVMNVIFALDPIYRLSLEANYGLSPEGATVLMAVMLVWVIALLCLMPVRRPSVPKLLIAGSWLYIILFWMIVLVFGAITPMSIVSFGTGIVYPVLFTWYWLKSKRVNVTYSNRVPAI